MASAIPVVDITPLGTDDGMDRAASTIEQIGHACLEWGFFQVVNHGVAPALGNQALQHHTDAGARWLD